MRWARLQTGVMCQAIKVVLQETLRANQVGASIMNKVTLISVDLAKDVFQVSGFTDKLNEVFNRQIKRTHIYGSTTGL